MPELQESRTEKDQCREAHSGRHIPVLSGMVGPWLPSKAECYSILLKREAERFLAYRYEHCPTCEQRCPCAGKDVVMPECEVCGGPVEKPNVTPRHCNRHAREE